MTQDDESPTVSTRLDNASQYEQRSVLEGTTVMNTFYAATSEQVQTPCILNYIDALVIFYREF